MKNTPMSGTPTEEALALLFAVGMAIFISTVFEAAGVWEWVARMIEIAALRSQ